MRASELEREREGEIALEMCDNIVIRIPIPER